MIHWRFRLLGLLGSFQRIIRFRNVLLGRLVNLRRQILQHLAVFLIL
ncbi:MAG: hypothetical protein NTX04_08145 [Verrucomicrobia bacterium]|nr:hypothetical protein [Verrucomicrobiota bacterium]